MQHSEYFPIGFLLSLHNITVARDKAHHWAALAMEILSQSQMVCRIRSRSLVSLCPGNSSFTPNPFCLPSALVRCERLMFPVWLQPQPALLSCSLFPFLPLTWPVSQPLPFQHQPSCRPHCPQRSLLSPGGWYALLSSFILLESCPFPMQSCLWLLGSFCSSSPVAPHSLPTCVQGDGIPMRVEQRESLLQSCIWKLDQVWCISLGWGPKMAQDPLWNQKDMLVPLWGYHKPWAGPRRDSFTYRGCGIGGCGKPRTKANLPGLTQSRKKKNHTQPKLYLKWEHVFVAIMFPFFLPGGHGEE